MMQKLAEIVIPLKTNPVPRKIHEVRSERPSLNNRGGGT